MTRIDLLARAVLEYADRHELTLSPAGLITHRGDVLTDDSARAVLDLCDAGLLIEDGDLIVPATVTDAEIHAVLATHTP